MRTHSTVFVTPKFSPNQKAQIQATVKQAIAAELGIPEEQVTPEMILAAFNDNKQQFPKSYGLSPDQQFRLQRFRQGNVLPHPATISSEDGAIVAFGDHVELIQNAMAETYGDRQPLSLTTITREEDKSKATFVSSVEGLPHLAVANVDLTTGSTKPVQRGNATNGQKAAMSELITQLLGMTGGYYRDPKLGDYNVVPFAVFNDVGQLSSIEVLTPYNPLAWMESDCGIDQSCVTILNGNPGTNAIVQRTLEKAGFKVPHATKKQPTPFTDCQTPAGFQPKAEDGSLLKMNPHGQYEKALFSVKVELVKDESKATIRFDTEYHGYRGVAIYVLGQLLSPRFVMKYQTAITSLVQWVHLAVCQFKQDIWTAIGNALQFDTNEVEQDGTVRFISNVGLNQLDMGVFKVQVQNETAYANRFLQELREQGILRAAFGQVVAIGGASLPVEIQRLTGFVSIEDPNEQPRNIA